MYTLMYFELKREENIGEIVRVNADQLYLDYKILYFILHAAYMYRFIHGSKTSARFLIHGSVNYHL